jgi:hypothetical protein
MKIKFLLLTLTLVMVFALATACGNTTTDDSSATQGQGQPADTGAGADAGASAGASDEGPALPSFSYEISVSGTVIWALSGDEHIQSLPMGERAVSGDEEAYEAFLDTPFLTEAGSPTLTIVQSPLGTNAIELRDRSADWNAMDFIAEAVDWDFNNTYTLTVFGNVANVNDGGPFVIGGADSPWSEFARVDINDSGDFVAYITISSEEDLSAAGDRQFFRMQDKSDEYERYTLYEIILSQN